MALPVKVGMNVRVLLGDGNRDGARIRFARVLTVVDQDNITAAFGHGTSFAATRSSQYSKYGLLFVQDSVAFALADLAFVEQDTNADATAKLAFSFRLTNDGGHAVTDIEAKIDAGSWTSVDSYTINEATGVGTAVVDGFSYDTAYAVRLRAVTSEGNGTQSDELSVTVTDTASVVPLQPTLGTVTPASGQLSVAFTVPWTGGSAITSVEERHIPTAYVVTDDYSNWSAWDEIGTDDTSPVVIAGLTNTVDYTFELRLVNANGASDPSSDTGTPSA